jgi:hypothetical protein
MSSSALPCSVNASSRSSSDARERPDPALVAAYEDTVVRYSSTWSGAAIDV